MCLLYSSIPRIYALFLLATYWGVDDSWKYYWFERLLQKVHIRKKKGEWETLIFQKFVRAFFNRNFRERLQIHK